MKVLKDNYNQDTNIKEETKDSRPYPRITICEKCGSELEYEESDLRMGWMGCMYLDCPLCGYENMLEDNENTITLTVDNIEFPTHFYHTSTSTGAVDCCNNEEIKRRIRKAIEYFRKNKDDYNWSSESGNLYVEVTKCPNDECYDITITNDYYSSYIPFESEDY